MNTYAKSFLCGMCFTAGCAVAVAGGLIINTQIGKTDGPVFRSDAQLELQGIDAMLSLFQTQNPGKVNSKETAIAFGAYNGAGVIAKTASISSKWGDVDGKAGFGVLRLNAATKGGHNDDVAIRVWGNRGVTFWGKSDAPDCEFQTMCVNGSIRIQGVTVFAKDGSLYWRDRNGLEHRL